MKNRREKQILGKGKIHRSIFQGDSLSQEKINHHMHIDDIKIFAKRMEKNWRPNKNNNQDIEMEFSIKKWAMLIM